MKMPLVSTKFPRRTGRHSNVANGANGRHCTLQRSPPGMIGKAGREYQWNPDSSAAVDDSDFDRSAHVRDRFTPMPRCLLSCR